MSSPPAEDQKLRLSGSRNWIQWQPLFESKARASDLWEHIDPQETEPLAFLSKPRMPDFATQQGVETRGSGPSEAEKHRLRIFELQDRQYATQARAVVELKRWVESTVERTLLQINCLPHTDLRVWYKNLVDAVGIDSQLARGQATIAFQRFMTPTGKTPRDLSKWVTEFESMMFESQALKVPNALESICWYTALQQLTQPFLGLKLEIWKSQFADELQRNTLSYRKVAKLIRFEVIMDDTLKKGTRGVKRGAFPASKETNELSTSEAENDKPQLKRRPKRSAYKKSNAVTRTCRACGQFHDLSHCFYVFKENVPTWFKPSSAMQRTVEIGLQHDEKLKEEVKKLRQTKGLSEASQLKD